MKNNLIRITFALLITITTSANATERTIASVIKEIGDGATIQEEMKKPPVSAGEHFLFIKKNTDNDLALYAIGTDNYQTYDGLAFIFVKVEKDNFYTSKQKLPKGNYKLIGSSVLTVKDEFPNAGSYDILEFERVK